MHHISFGKPVYGKQSLHYKLLFLLKINLNLNEHHEFQQCKFLGLTQYLGKERHLSN